MHTHHPLPLTLSAPTLLGQLTIDDAPAPLTDATWYTAQALEDGLLYRFPTGALAEARFLSADFLLDGTHLAAFTLILQEGDEGPRFGYEFGLLNQCQARLRMPLEAVNQNRWLYPREGALLKPRSRFERVDLRRVDRLLLVVDRKSERPVRFCLTDFVASVDEPPRLEAPLLPEGKLLDELGQSTIHAWPGKTQNEKELRTRLRTQHSEAASQAWPSHFSRWGGDARRRFEATGFFCTHYDESHPNGARWWLVDPDGCAFWSAGMDCVRVDTSASVDGLETALAWLPPQEGEYAAAYQGRGGRKVFSYLAANFIRIFGTEDWYARWAEIALAQLRGLGFNTVANWSDWAIARPSSNSVGFPYVRPLGWRDDARRAAFIYRDFPDVFDPTFADDATAFAEPLHETRDDPALIGYFLMNEPTWGFAEETPAAGMLFNTTTCHARRALADFLCERHPDDEALSAAWGLDTTLAAVAEGEWTMPLTEAAQRDLADFSEVMVTRFFTTLSDACRAVDPNHLNLGVRYHTVPPAWALAGMKRFDVFSMNCYRERVPADELARIHALLGVPTLIGEWHFGALDVGLPAAGIGHVRDQAARGQAFRVYVEDAAAQPHCVGVHWFTLYDQSTLGRYDGEHYNIGFLDVCNRPYAALAEAARVTHERVYGVASGEVAAAGEVPEYLPRLFL